MTPPVRRPPVRRSPGGFTLIELMIVVAIIGILAAIAIPNFIKFQARSKQSEVKSNLKAGYTAEQAWYQEKDAYTQSVRDVGFQPERGNRYAYYFASTAGTHCIARSSATETVAADSDCFLVDTFKFTDAAANPAAVVSAGAIYKANGWFNLSAAGNIDSDADIDAWSISSLPREQGSPSVPSTGDGNGGSNGSGRCAAGNNPSGEPCCDFNDI